MLPRTDLLLNPITNEAPPKGTAYEKVSQRSGGISFRKNQLLAGCNQKQLQTHQNHAAYKAKASGLKTHQGQGFFRQRSCRFQDFLRPS